MKSSVFYDITLCNQFKVNRRFGGTYFLHLQVQRIRQARNPGEAGRKQSSDFMLGLLLNPEYGGDMFLRNFDLISTNYMA
jgi:hypothetical protein